MLERLRRVPAALRSKHRRLDGGHRQLRPLTGSLRDGSATASSDETEAAGASAGAPHVFRPDVDLESEPSSLAIGGTHSCVSYRDHSTHCWRGFEEGSDFIDQRGIASCWAGGDRMCLLSASNRSVEQGEPLFSRHGGGRLFCYGGGVDGEEEYCGRECDGYGQVVGGDFNCLLGTDDLWDTNCNGLGTDYGVWEGPGDHDIAAELASFVTVETTRDPRQINLTDVGPRHACIVFGNKRRGMHSGSANLYCWGANGYGQIRRPSFAVEDFAVGGWHTCAIRKSTGQLACWGAGEDPSRQEGPHDWDQSVAPKGRYAVVAAGQGYSCAIRRGDRRVRCWGRDDHGQASPPDEKFQIIAAATLSATARAPGWTCGVTVDEEVLCWGARPGTDGGDEPPVDVRASTEAADARRVALTNSSSCALDAEGEVHCWGNPSAGRRLVPDGPFRSIAADSEVVCGVRPGGGVECWGQNILEDRLGLVRRNLRTTPPAGRYRTVAPGYDGGCGMGVDGEATCWGDERLPEELTGEPVRQIAGWNGRYCGIRRDRSVVCWTRNTAAPEGTFVRIDLGRRWGCGIRHPDGDLTCWRLAPPDSGGVDEKTDEPPTLLERPPAGPFDELAVGRRHVCASREESGRVECWSEQIDEEERVDRATPPQGRFRTLAAGRDHTCGVRRDGDVVCWGIGSEPDRNEGETDYNQSWSRLPRVHAHPGE